MRDEVTRTLDERGEVYGEAWLTCGKVTKLLASLGLMTKIEHSMYFHNWIIILSKMIRLLATPNHQDSWHDIAGYATLVDNHITTEQEAARARGIDYQQT